jgi:hypothetical protein
MKYTDVLCGQTAEFLYVKAGGTYSNHWASKIKYPSNTISKINITKIIVTCFK